MSDFGKYRKIPKMGSKWPKPLKQAKNGQKWVIFGSKMGQDYLPLFYPRNFSTINLCIRILHPLDFSTEFCDILVMDYPQNPPKTSPSFQLYMLSCPNKPCKTTKYMGPVSAPVSAPVFAPTTFLHKKFIGPKSHRSKIPPPKSVQRNQILVMGYS